MMNIAGKAIMCSVVLGLLSACAGAPPRSSKSPDELLLLTQQFVAENNAAYDAARETMLRRMELELAQSSRPEDVTFDVLVIHGGGAAGGFAAGFLRGWGEVTDPAFSRPEFDLVTGSSSGALLAPFAFVGTEQAYRDAFDAALRPPTFAEPSVFALWPSRSSLLSSAALEEGISAVVDAEFVADITRGAEERRALLVGVTDIDVGLGRAWDLTLEASSLPPDRAQQRIEEVILASAAIPVVFPPIEINGRWYTDGGVAATMFMGFDVFAVQWLVEQWKRRHPDLPMPKLRVWVLVNAKLFIDEETIQPRYPDIAMRSINIMMAYDRLKALFMMAFMVREMNALDDVQAEFRYAAIPEDATVPNDLSELGNTAMVRTLVDLGYTMGSDPNSWSEGAPMLLRLPETVGNPVSLE